MSKDATPFCICSPYRFFFQFEIRLCPALQKKPALPTPNFDPHTKELPVQEHNGGTSDPFSPPYIPNLHVGDLKDESGTEYVLLVCIKYLILSRPH